MGPEEFFHRNRLINKDTLFEMRVKSLDWMLGCYKNGTIRRRTIINLIPLENLYDLLKHMEEIERYEDCVIIKDVIDIIYEQTKQVKMSTKKQKEIISLLENTIKSEQDKVGGGNTEIIEKLEKKLNQVKDWRPKDE